jgi:hypothetical protein
MAKLVAISEEVKNLNFELNDERITVGRLSDNLIALEYDAVSSHHAQLNRKGDEYILRDLNSTNGTRVNGQRITEIRLSNGDSVLFGNLEFQYVSSAGSVRPMPAVSGRFVNLSNTAVMSRPATAYGNSSPFSNGKGGGKKSSMFLYAMIGLGVIGVGLLGFIVIKILGT